MVYLPKNQLNVGKYTSPMDPMGMKAHVFFFSPGFLIPPLNLPVSSPKFARQNSQRDGSLRDWDGVLPTLPTLQPASVESQTEPNKNIV